MALITSPMLYATVQACVLNATSGVIAQILTAYRTNSAYTIDWTPIIQFVIFTALNTPPNFLWQTYLEEKFPSTYLVPSTSAVDAAASSNEKELDREQRTSEIFESRLSKRNTFAKFALDQTLGSAINTVIYLIGFGGISGKSWEQSVGSVREEFWGLIFAGWKVWPLVSFLNFAIIQSVELRGLIGCLAGMGWSIFLSLKSS